MSAVNLLSIENSDSFSTESIEGLAMDFVKKHPKVKMTTESLEAAGEKRNSAVQYAYRNFNIGEIVRRLPHCQHMFHLPCIDSWLIGHGTCPLCRRGI